MKHRITQLILVGGLALTACISASAQNAVADWNGIAVKAIAPNATPGMTGIYMAYVDLAVFDALNAIHPHFQPYAGIQPPAASDASEGAAVAAAAHDVLVHYFPGQAASLDTIYLNYLVSLADSSSSKDAGVLVGQMSAAALIALRNNDGLVGANTYVFQPVGPGVYQQTPPFPYAGPQTPWIANMTPFTMTSASQFLPDEGPTPLSSDQWAEDYNRTKLWGAIDSTVRSAEQTTIGLFWTANGGPPYTGMVQRLINTHALSELDSARLFAMVFTGYGDAFIGCMNAKYHFNFWRPVTAIREGDIDGNADTIADPSWTPLATTPNHPEYPAAHGCVTAAVTATLADYFGTSKLPLSVTATYNVPGVGPVTSTRSFSSTDDLLAEVKDARIFGGMHFHHSIQQGSLLGQKVSRQLSKNYFQPLGGK